MCGLDVLTPASVLRLLPVTSPTPTPPPRESYDASRNSGGRERRQRVPSGMQPSLCCRLPACLDARVEHRGVGLGNENKTNNGSCCSGKLSGKSRIKKKRKNLKRDSANLSAVNNRFGDGKRYSHRPAAGTDDRASGLIVNC